MFGRWLSGAADALSAGLAKLNSIIESIPILGGATRAVSGRAADGSELSTGQRAAAFAGSAFDLFSLGSGGLSGTRAAVREGLGSLGLTEDVAAGVRRVLGSGAGSAWGVEAAEGGGAVVRRWVPGNNTVSSALYTYVIDASGGVASMAKQAYDAAGAIAGTLKMY